MLTSLVCLLRSHGLFGDHSVRAGDREKPLNKFSESTLPVTGRVVQAAMSLLN